MDMNFLSNIIIKKINFVSKIYSEKNKVLKRTNRSGWALVLKYEGETIYNSNGNSYVSNRDNLIILPKGCSYELTCIQAGHFSIIEFECETEYSGIFGLPLKNSEKIHQLFMETEYKRTIKKTMYEMESIRNCYSIILNATETSTKKYIPNVKQSKIVPALEYIAKNYEKNIRNDELASLSGLSVVYFRKLFTEVTGTSPNAYIQEIRIKKAKEMLKSDYNSITEIAKSLGYSNIYHFSREFKKHVGIPPSKY